MKALGRLSIALVLLAVAVNCSDSGGPDTTVEDLVGTWSATRFQIEDESGTIAPIDLINLGGSLVITIAANGNFTGTFKATALSLPTTVAGTVSIQQGTLSLGFTDGLDEPIAGGFVLGDNALTITGSGLTVDFEGQTIPAATVILILQRQ
jgi:hypothetical protein